MPQASGTRRLFSLGLPPPPARPGSALPAQRPGPSSHQELSPVGRFPSPLLPMVHHSASSPSQPSGHRPHLLPKCPMTAAWSGSRPPGVTPHCPFLLCLVAPPEGLFRALNMEWESRPSPPTPLGFSEMCLLSAPPYRTQTPSPRGKNWKEEMRTPLILIPFWLPLSSAHPCPFASLQLAHR